MRQSCCTTAQSSSFSKMFVGSPGDRKPGETRAAAAGAPAGHRHAECGNPGRDRADIDAASLRAAAPGCRSRRAAHPAGAHCGDSIVVLGQRQAGHDGYLLSSDVQRVNAWALPASTLMILRGRLGRGVGREEIHRLGDVLGQHVQLEHRAVAVELLELLARHRCHRHWRAPCASRRPRSASRGSRRPGFTTLTRMPERRALEREAAGQVHGGGLCRRIGRGIRRRGQRVLRADEDDRSATSAASSAGTRRAQRGNIPRRARRSSGARARPWSPRSARRRRGRRWRPGCPARRTPPRRRRTPPAPALRR